MIAAMPFSALEGRTLEELIAAFRGPPLGGEEHRAAFYDDLADAIATRGGIDFLQGEVDQADEVRLAAAVSALAFWEDPSVDRHRLLLRLRQLLDDANPDVVVTAIDSLRQLADREIHEHVLELLGSGPGMVRAHALIYLRVLLPDSALELLIAALRDPDAAVRFTAVDQLDEFETVSDRETFEGMLDDPDEDVREHARYILEQHSSEIADSAQAAGRSPVVISCSARLAPARIPERPRRSWARRPTTARRRRVHVAMRRAASGPAPRTRSMGGPRRIAHGGVIPAPSGHP